MRRPRSCERSCARGFYDSEVDGKLGLAARVSVRTAQQKFGLPADSYPSPEPIARLQSPKPGPEGLRA